MILNLLGALLFAPTTQEYCVPGTQVEAASAASEGRWFNAVVVEALAGGGCVVEYDGYGPEWNEQVPMALIGPRRPPEAPQAAIGRPNSDWVRSGCVPGHPVESFSQTDHWNARVLGPSTRPGMCVVSYDGFSIRWDEIVETERLLERRGTPEEAARRAFNQSQPPPPPSDAMRTMLAEAAATGIYNPGAQALAQQSYADAFAYFEVYALTVNDSNIVARICNHDRSAELCQRANASFFEGVAQNGRRIDAENAAYFEGVRAAHRAGAGEPINSGYYQSGAYSRDVAASQAGMPSPAQSATSGPPVQVQSESQIRQDQARCRAGSGPC